MTPTMSHSSATSIPYQLGVDQHRRRDFLCSN
jgi:hypothetical protein